MLRLVANSLTFVLALNSSAAPETHKSRSASCRGRFAVVAVAQMSSSLNFGPQWLRNTLNAENSSGKVSDGAIASLPSERSVFDAPTFTDVDPINVGLRGPYSSYQICHSS